MSGLFDVQCWDLARAFLEDHEPKPSPAELERHTNQLAELIQKTIEDYLQFDVKSAYRLDVYRVMLPTETDAWPVVTTFRGPTAQACLDQAARAFPNREDALGSLAWTTPVPVGPDEKNERDR
jgi:hypothetical protein